MISINFEFKPSMPFPIKFVDFRDQSIRRINPISLNGGQEKALAHPTLTSILKILIQTN